MKKYRTHCLILLFFWVLLLACLGFISFVYFGDKTIIVSVLDSQTHQSIAGAMVEANNTPVAHNADAFELKPADNSLGVIPQIQLKVTAPGYLPREITLFIPWWQRQREVAISLEPTQLVGKVTDASTGDPLLAEVYVSDGQTPLEQIAPIAATNTEGYFEAWRLEPPLTLQIKALGYKTWQTQLDSSVLFTTEQPFVLDIPLVSRNIIGKVTDAWTGDPLPATVYLTDNQPSELSKQIIADNEGYFEAKRLEPPLTLQIEAPGYQMWQTQLDALALTGNPAHKLAVNLIPRTTIGVLRAADTNEPLANLTLRVNSGDHLQTVTTDAAGRFELHRLVPGDPITIQAPAGYLSTEITFNNEPELTLALQPHSVTVIVRDNFTSSPIAGATVTFNQILTTTADAQGQATMSRVPTSGQISVTQSGYHPLTLDYQGDERVEAIMTPTGLQGIVRGRDTGQPLPQATLYLNHTILQTDEEGRFVVETLPATPEQIVVKSAGYHRAYAQLSQTGVLTNYAPPFSGVEGRWLVTAPCAQGSTQPGPPCLDLFLEPFQVKAIYVPFHYLRSRQAILRYLDFIQATELNAIVVDVKGDFGFVGWQSEVELAETVGADGERTDTWMPLDELVAEAKKRNIYAIARFVVFKDNPLAHGKPELAAVREDGTVWLDGEELGWANPFKEEVWDYNIALAQEVAAFGFDELNFDYIRFPSDGEVGAIVYEEENTLETRTAAIREFMQRLTDALRPHKIFTSADVFGLTIWVRPESDMNIGQRIVDIAPHVDYLAPMVYPSTFIPGNLGYDNPSAEPYGIVFRSQHQAEVRVPPYVKVRPWLQGYWYSLDQMRLLKQAAIDAKSTGWSWWNAGGKYDNELFEPADK